jgi:hypothetical protein
MPVPLAALPLMVDVPQNRAALRFSFGLVEMAIYGTKGNNLPYYVQPRLLLQTEIVTRTVFVVGPGTLESKIQDVSLAGKPETISDQEYFSSLAALDPSLPDRLRNFLDECQSLGCAPELKKAYVLYIDDPTGSRLNIGTIRKVGKAEIWGVSRRDKQFGEPIGRQYMERVAKFLRNAHVKDDFETSAEWHVRFDEKSFIPLDVMLNHSKEWLAAIQGLVEQFRAIEHKEETSNDPDERL